MKLNSDNCYETIGPLLDSFYDICGKQDCEKCTISDHDQSKQCLGRYVICFNAGYDSSINDIFADFVNMAHGKPEEYHFSWDDVLQILKKRR